MKICFLAHLEAVRTRRLAVLLRDMDHAVEVVSLTPGPALEDITTYVLQERWSVSYERTNWHYLAALPRLCALLRTIRPDLVYAQFVSSYGVLGALACPAGLPIVLAVQGADLLDIAHRSFVHRTAARFALRRANLVLSPAEHLTCEVRRLCVSTPALTMQYGVDTARFHPGDGETERAPLVLSARALVPGMGIETVLRAARLFHLRGSPLTFEVADDGKLRPALEHEVRDLVSAGRVRFIGRLGEDQLAEHLRSAAIYVSMSQADGTSMTFMEALASGAFPVVSDIPANRPWIVHGKTGLLVPPGDASQLADLLDRAWSDREMRLRATRANVQTIQSRMDVRRNLQEIEAAMCQTATARRYRVRP